MTKPALHEHNGQMLTMAELAAIKGCEPSTMRKRIRALGVERAMREPILTYSQAAQRAGKKARKNAANPFNRFSVGWRKRA